MNGLKCTLTQRFPEILLTLNTLRQKAFIFLQMVAASETQQGEILSHLFFE